MNLNITSKRSLIQFAIAVRILKPRVPYFLHCSFCTIERLAFLNVIQDIDNSILEIGDSHIAEVLLYGKKFLGISSNTNILNSTIDFLLETNRFDERLF